MWQRPACSLLHCIAACNRAVMQLPCRCRPCTGVRTRGSAASRGRVRSPWPCCSRHGASLDSRQSLSAGRDLQGRMPCWVSCTDRCAPRARWRRCNAARRRRPRIGAAAGLRSCRGCFQTAVGVPETAVLLPSGARLHAGCRASAGAEGDLRCRRQAGRAPAGAAKGLTRAGARAGFIGGRISLPSVYRRPPASHAEAGERNSQGCVAPPAWRSRAIAPTLCLLLTPIPLPSRAQPPPAAMRRRTTALLGLALLLLGSASARNLQQAVSGFTAPCRGL